MGIGAAGGSSASGRVQGAVQEGEGKYAQRPAVSSSPTPSRPLSESAVAPAVAPAALHSQARGRTGEFASSPLALSHSVSNMRVSFSASPSQGLQSSALNLVSAVANSPTNSASRRHRGADARKSADIHTYIHVYIQLTYTHVYIYTNTCIEKVSSLTYIYTYTHTYTHTYIHTYIYTYIHTYIYTYIHTYIHIYIICTYIHIYICTCIHTYRRALSTLLSAPETLGPQRTRATAHASRRRAAVHAGWQGVGGRAHAYAAPSR